MSAFTAELADWILAGLAGGRTLHDICIDDDLPSCRTVYHWVSEDHEGFTARYYQARDAGRCTMGRPTLYTPELAERILHELADGRTVRDICRADGMPAAATVRLWVVQDRDSFAARYRRAREFAYDGMSEGLLEIVDDGRNDWMERHTKQGKRETVPNREIIQRSRLRYDARRWLLSNALPKTYGRRIAPDAKEEIINPWAEIMKRVNGKSRGLPSEDEPVDERELEELERKFQKAAGPPTDRL